MLHAQSLEDLRKQIATLPRPVLTVWAQTGEALGGSTGEATRVRVRGALSELRERGQSYAPELEDALLEALGRPGGHGTVLLLAAPASSEKPQILLQHFAVELPVGSAEREAEAHLGAPELAPLDLAVSGHPRVGALEVHDRGLCLYEIFLGEAEAVLELDVPTMPGEHDRLQNSKPVHPAHTPDRGGSVYDDVDEHREAWLERFFGTAAPKVEAAVKDRAIEALILMGSTGLRERFADRCPKGLRDKIIATAAAPAKANAKTQAIVEALREPIDHYRKARQAKRMDELRDRGVLGLESCLEMLQRGQLELLFLPWDLDREVYVEPETGRVAETPGQARIASGQEDAELDTSPARNKLVELAHDHATEIAFTRTGASPSPFDHVEGVAGLPRWG